MHYLPSKKLIALVAGILCVGGGVFLVQNFVDGTVFIQEKQGASELLQSVRDTDNDGLRDWEERILGTNQKNPDTDGDGTRDGDEIKKNRNPFVAPPDLIATPEALREQAAGESTDATTSVTEAFAKEFLSVLMLEKGEMPVQDTLNETLSSLFENIAALPAPEYFKEGNIRTVSQDTETLRAYGNAMITAIGHHPGANSGDAFAAFQKVITGTNAEATALLLIEENYGDLARELSELSVPEGLLPTHLDIINGIRTLGDSVHDLQFLATDPLRASIGLSTYLKYLNKELAFFAEVKKIFHEHGVVFSAEDAGAAWNSF